MPSVARRSRKRYGEQWDVLLTTAEWLDDQFCGVDGGRRGCSHRRLALVVVYSLNMFGDAVRDLLDPRLRGRLGRYGAGRE